MSADAKYLLRALCAATVTATEDETDRAVDAVADTLLTDDGPPPHLDPRQRDRQERLVARLAEARRDGLEIPPPVRLRLHRRAWSPPCPNNRRTQRGGKTA